MVSIKKWIKPEVTKMQFKNHLTLKIMELSSSDRQNVCLHKNWCNAE